MPRHRPTGTAPLPLIGPGIVGAGIEVACEYGCLPSGYGPLTRATIVSLGATTATVRVYGETTTRRVPNDMIRLYHRQELAEQYPRDRRDVARPYGGGCTNPRTWQWLPHYAWIGWTIAEHLQYARGERPLAGEPARPPARLVIVGCGWRKRERATDAFDLYVGSYYRAARRAADALLAAADDGYQAILSAKYGLLDLHDVIGPYDVRMGQPGAIGADTVAYQAQQQGLLGARKVVVLAGRAYADVVTSVWPHAQRPLDGTAGIGEQLQRLAAIAAAGATAG
ncbi:DUF6884 domain-containing protein [Dactylosporangium sucinum]|uniref:DUF6884 domain-containing protein n=1 Tax=Dactylosporangium sucinum TaxID=1424081 RepID=A0A917X8N0_9ACTN|nr:DUF6884 domain-containing protein [Dactylosporangium sucinum]GGM90028.1 hypothetical protein GCM10007977_110100 [Dactylosporangium sucinum]